MIQNTTVETPQYRGEPVNKELKNGPLEDRQKTDFGFCIAFIIFLSIYIIIGIFVGLKGDLNKADQGFDRNGNGCGLTDSTKDFKYLYSERHFNNYRSLGTSYSSVNADDRLWDCVKECPKLNEKIICAQTRIKGSRCDLPSEYDTQVAHGQYCVQVRAKLEFQGGWNGIGESIAEKWYVFVLTSLVAILCGLIVLLWVRFAAKCMIWSSIIIFILLLVLAGVLVMSLGRYVSNAATTNNGTNQTVQNGGNNLTVFGMVFWFFALIIAIIVYCLRNTINFLCGILSAASEFVKDNCSILVFPILAGVLVLVVKMAWVFVFVKSAFLGNPAPKLEIGYQHQARIIPPSYGAVLYAFNGFAFFWIGLYILHFSQFIVCSSASIWYFSSGKDENCVSKATSRTINFHLGSIAFGSFILAVIKFLRSLVNDNKDNKEGGGAAQLIYALLSFCLKCLEKLIEYLGLHAYIEVALTGKSFCDAAKDGFYLILRNALRFGVSIKLFEWFEVLASIYTLFLSLPISIIIIIKMVQAPIGIVSFIIFAVLISGLVAFIFTGIIVIAANTVLHCYCVDVEIAEQEGRRDALFAPQVLHETIAEYRASQEDK